MRDDDDLVRTGQPRQPPADLNRGAPTHPGVDLVEHHRGALGRRRQHHLQRQHQARQLTSGGALVDGQHRRTTVRGEPELDTRPTPSAARRGRSRPDGRVSGRRIVGPCRQRLHGDRELRVTHCQPGQFGSDSLRQALRRLGPGLGEVGRRVDNLDRRVRRRCGRARPTRSRRRRVAQGARGRRGPTPARRRCRPRTSASARAAGLPGQLGLQRACVAGQVVEIGGQFARHVGHQRQRLTDLLSQGRSARSSLSSSTDLACPMPSTAEPPPSEASSEFAGQCRTGALRRFAQRVEF